MLKNPAGFKRENSSVKFTAISRQVSPDSLLGACWDIPESSGGRIRSDENSDVEHTVDQKMVAVLGTPCAIPPLNSNQYIT
jgi:hypothetical protein